MSTAEELKNTHWRQLKAMVEDAGGEWTDKQSAIDFLIQRESLTEESRAEEAAPTETDAAKKVAEKTPVFDKSRPYSEVHGISIARYRQGGHYFGGDHNYISPEEMREYNSRHG